MGRAQNLNFGADLGHEVVVHVLHCLLPISIHRTWRVSGVQLGLVLETSVRLRRPGNAAARTIGFPNVTDCGVADEGGGSWRYDAGRVVAHAEHKQEVLRHGDTRRGPVVDEDTDAPCSLPDGTE